MWMLLPLFRLCFSTTVGKSQHQSVYQGIMGTTMEIPPSAELIANNVDLLTEILLRSPAKSLIRFKCVSKKWLSLLSDSQFASSHSRRNPNPAVASLFLYQQWNLYSVSLNGSSTPTYPSLSFLNLPTDSFRILDSRNGLLLIRFKVSSLPSSPQFMVCNPTTRNYHVCQHSGGDVLLGFFAFDPSKSRYFKVVLVPLLPMDGIGTTPSIEIYSSETACWRNIHPVYPREIRYRYAEVWKGDLLWLSFRNNLIRLETETGEMIVVPCIHTAILPPHQVRYFGVCSGRLFLITTDSQESQHAPGFLVLEMDKDYRWNVKWHVFPEVEGRNLDDGSVRSVVKVVVGRENDLVLILSLPGKVIAYNLQKKTWNTLYVLWPGEIYFCLQVYQFVESLAPV